MRQKAENEARDRYSRRYAAVLAVEAMFDYRARGIKRVITVEAEDSPLWEDVVRSVTGAAWPDRYAELNAQFENLADRIENT